MQAFKTLTTYKKKRMKIQAFNHCEKKRIEEMQKSHEKVLAEEIRARDAQLHTALEELQVGPLVGQTPRFYTSE